MPRRTLAALLCVAALLAACGTAVPTPAPRAQQIAQVTQVAAAVQASAEVRGATQTAQAQPTATPTVAPTNTRPPLPSVPPTITRPPTSTVPPTWTPYPTATFPPSGAGLPPGATVPPAPPVGTTIGPFFDNFADPASGWHTEQIPGRVELGYAPDGYRARIDRLGSWAEVPNRTFLSLVRDVSVEVDVTSLGAAVAGNGYGIICRYRDDQNWYALSFSTDGRFLISRMYRGAERALAGTVGVPGAGPNPLLPPPGKPARLRADCVGDTLTLSVNGQVLAQVQDTSIVAGAVALYACTCGRQGPIDIRFNELVIWPPDPAVPQGPAPARP